VARIVPAAGPILCGVCGTEFTTDDPEEADEQDSDTE
jgi:hypothetical protein